MDKKITLLKDKKNWDNRGFVRFRKDIESIKIKVLYKKLRDKLSLNTKRLSHDALIGALDSSAEDYANACDLYLIVLNEEEKFKIFYDVEMSNLMSRASRFLEKKKAKKEITSQITAELKKAWIIKNEKENYVYLETKRTELRIARKRMESLKDAWNKRASSLQSQARAIESKRSLVLGKGEKENG